MKDQTLFTEPPTKKQLWFLLIENLCKDWEWKDDGTTRMTLNSYNHNGVSFYLCIHDDNTVGIAHLRHGFKSSRGFIPLMFLDAKVKYTDNLKKHIKNITKQFILKNKYQFDLL